MQIHEITESRVKEGFLGDLGNVAKGVGKNIFTAAGGGDLGTGNAAKSAVASAAGLTAQGYGPGAPKPSDRWEDKYKQVQQDPSVKQYAANLAQTWLKNSATLTKNQPKTVAPTTTSTAKDEPVFVGGQQLNPKDPKDAKLLATLKGKGKLAEVADPAYTQAFKQWADQTLATRVPSTGETATMDKVERLPGLGDQLKQALAQVTATQGTPQHAQAIQNYIVLAVAGIQAVAQTSKNKYGTVKTNIGIGTQELASLKALARTPQGAAVLKQELGL